jgi:1-acyl-sn-glycerol-3-phosphate acyltransferase
MQPLKAGIFHLARAFQDVDIVPVWIDNSHRVLPKGAAVPRPGRCRIRFGTPLRLPEAEPVEKFLARLREALEGLQSA